METEQTLYNQSFEHDACGIGAVVSIDGIASHSIVDDALKIVERLDHRAGKDASGETGDGVGILTQLPHRFFSGVVEGLPCRFDYGVGMLFLPRDEALRREEIVLFEDICKEENVPLLLWRKVPSDCSILGKKAADSMPCIMQCFVGRPAGIERGLPFERKLYVLRRLFEKSCKGTYVCSLSSRTIVYKGMFLVSQLRRFYPDLQDEAYESALAMVHSRFSTNTMPSWDRAHPNRVILHNGEINTIRGNADRMLAREETMRSPVMGEDMAKVLPVISGTGSDSAMLDNTLEFLVMNGVPLPLAVMILIPEPYKNDANMTRSRRDLYRYYATMMESWDGPAAILFSDGEVMGAVLDRNGLRPARYCLTKDRRLILSSETGALDIPEENILQKSRLSPGKMLLVDMNRKAVISDEECKEYYASRQPYGEWLDSNLVPLASLPIPNRKIPLHSVAERDRLYRFFGYTYEDVNDVIMAMAKNGIEPTSSMGCDVPLAVLSGRHPLLFDYFKQLFAQVTNPPIDSIREKIVTDTTLYLGSDGNLLDERAENCNVLQINNPILTSVDLMKIRSMDRPGFSVRTVSLLYDVHSTLEEALDRLFRECDGAYSSGANIIILSDRGVDENNAAIPSLLAVSAMEQHLIRNHRRTAVSIILESGEPREVHHFAALLGYGARAINPYLAQECVSSLIDSGRLDKDYHTAIDDYNKAILNGIVKISAKMGISTLQSYQSAQIFEAVGIDQDVIDRYFTNTVSPIGGIGLEEIGEDVLWRHSQAMLPAEDEDCTLDSSGAKKLKLTRSGNYNEEKMYDRLTVMALREAARSGSYEKYKEYAALAENKKTPCTLRGLMEFVYPAGGGIPIDEVESVSEIVKRFKTGAMSYGSISEEAHKCLAAAMNMLGGKSNCGEGGEESARLGTLENSAIKQVASGRFGVTSEYLCNAEEIQIKIAQGAKPGEGGHLPGKKVYPWIAKTRYSTPGVSLISPPPHHDIYSIEDLSQLIYDLKNAGREAEISVKLVSEAGVGTIAAGAAKAGAGVILISGYDGGTGAAPISSIYNAGLPFELGLAEAHQTLVRNGLRSRVRLEADGKLMTGRDVAVACILGAEEFGFSTAPLICMGCVMDRACSLDTCPVGIATQNPALRAKFSGKLEYVVSFMTFVAEELREIMARLGVRRVDDLVGHTEYIRTAKSLPPRVRRVDLSDLIGTPLPVHYESSCKYDFRLEETLDEKVLIPEFQPYFDRKEPHEVSVSVSNTDRAAGVALGSAITKKFHGETLPEEYYTVRCSGSGGQSFGAFIPRGLTMVLVGDANDGFGKGLSGGKLIVKPHSGSKITTRDNIIVGNVALYGATGGKAFICGAAGERFCVRNSGAAAVVEGCGDHGCEYMTGGAAVILGKTGRNFAAGMSGGVVFVLDEHHDLYLKLNKKMVVMSEVTDRCDAEMLKSLIEEHVSAVNSAVGREILDSFESYLPKFKKIVPKDYLRMVGEIDRLVKVGLTWDEAELQAFYNLKKA